MQVRVKFSKLGALRFIGHLDIMRYFQKALSRSRLPVKYTQGFHPHLIMSFASPLGVGLTSDGEYLDFELDSDIDSQIIFSELSKSVSDGIRIQDITILNPRELNQKKISAMSLVSSADYLIYLKDCVTSEPDFDSIEKLFTEFMDQKSIVINKKTKKSEQELDIRPFIYNYKFDLSSFEADHAVSKEISNNLRCSITQTKYAFRLYMHLSSGSVMNLKPETIMETFIEYAKLPLDINDLQIHRLEMYHDSEKGCVPLWAIR